MRYSHQTVTRSSISGLINRFDEYRSPYGHETGPDGSVARTSLARGSDDRFCGASIDGSEVTLWVKSDVLGAPARYLLLPPSDRDCDLRPVAKCQKRPKFSATKSQLFDHLVSGREQSVWNSKAKRFGGFQVECQLEFGSKATFSMAWPDVRFTTESRHRADIGAMLQGTTNGLASSSRSRTAAILPQRPPLTVEKKGEQGNA